MATVHIPAPMRSLTGGETDVTAPGETLGALVENLEARYPGLQQRLCEGERVRPGLAVFVNGVQVPSRLSTRLPENADIYFAPAIAGGSHHCSRGTETLRNTEQPHAKTRRRKEKNLSTDYTD